ncbi:MAG: deoxyribodipyrimidine photo-lyase [Ekhidna sp.]|nr:deoxyribodipyrimidine photo-lyase [Ekhidna sp.]
MESINIVWLKRDLRTQDHAPLHAAEKAGKPYRIIYIFEPSILRHPDSALRHQQFIYHSLIEMNRTLQQYERKVEIFHAEAVEVFKDLINQFEIGTVFSHQETGIEQTWLRDKEVYNYLKNEGILWKEYQRDGVVRGITNRDGWDKNWFVTMSEPTIENTFSRNSSRKTFQNAYPLADEFKKQLEDYPTFFQPAGEKNGWRYLTSFADGRGFDYNRHISKPAKSRKSGGRISPYLAWGNLSIKQAYQFVKKHENLKSNKRAFGAFLTRLKWHCHFIQKFEVECEYEHTCINRGYELLPHESDPKKLQAWKDGKTGFPMVDACMRSVIKTGWLNFRMRAMLVSFLCHHLDQDWRDGVYHLAHQFLDYEPSIHYPQFQMQAGTTGINTVRIYNPVKQSQDHDPEGEFIKKWIPELVIVPIEHIHEPWKMTELEQSFCGFQIGRDYPPPIVDLQESGKIARTKVWGHRKNQAVKDDSKRILATHTRAGRRNP